MRTCLRDVHLGTCTAHFCGSTTQCMRHTHSRDRFRRVYEIRAFFNNIRDTSHMNDPGRKKSGTKPSFIQDNDMWKMTFNAVPDAVAIIDENHRIVQVNKAMAECLGMKPDQCIGLTCYAAVHGLEAPPSFCPHARLLKDGSEQREEVYEPRLGGTCIVTVSPLLDEKGSVKGSVHVARDITERKHMEDDLRLLNRELQETNTKLQEAYRWMRDSRDLLKQSLYTESLCFLVDSEGRIEWTSERATECIGKSRGELIACLLEDLLQPSCRDQFRHALKQGRIGILNPIEVGIIPAGGGNSTFEVKITRLTSVEQRRLLVLLIPATESQREY